METEQIHFRLSNSVIQYIKNDFGDKRYTNHTSFITFSVRAYYLFLLTRVSQIMTSYNEKLSDPRAVEIFKDLSITPERYLREKMEYPASSTNPMFYEKNKDPVTIRLPPGMINEISNFITKLGLFESLGDFILNAIAYQIDSENTAMLVSNILASENFDITELGSD